MEGSAQLGDWPEVIQCGKAKGLRSFLLFAERQTPLAGSSDSMYRIEERLMEVRGQ
jgi:hypothetical protein